MHPSLIISVLLLFSRHVSAAPNIWGGEPAGQSDGGIIRHTKRYDDGFWYIGKYPDGGTKSPVTPPEGQVGAPNDGIQSPETPSKEAPGDGTQPPETPSKEAPGDGTQPPEAPPKAAPPKPGSTKPPDPTTAAPEEEPTEESSATPKEETTAPKKTEAAEKDKKKENDDKEKKEDQQECRPLSENKYVPRDTLIDAVKGFCNMAERQGVQDKNSGGIALTSYGGTADEVVIGVDWEGSDNKPNYDDCKKELTRLVDDCSPTSDDDNKHNVKAGGTRRAEGGIFTYRITPAFKRHDYNNPIAGKCECDKKEAMAHEDCHIYGRGWASGDWAVRLRENGIRSCKEWGDTKWYFNYDWDEDSEWEWKGMMQLHFGQRSCFWDAIMSQDAPGSFECKTIV